MFFSNILLFNDFNFFFSNNLNFKINIFNENLTIYYFNWLEFINQSKLNFDYNYNIQNDLFLTLYSNVNELLIFNNIENLNTIYHYSIPNVKLFYPEPFIASASFMHSDLWFMHILIYQYWLWFVFIFLIVFFFLVFLYVIRWCNIRTKPKRETRGVSRSKCGDLITAFVPVSWAASIIINESTDAMDFYDGFGTTELVIGIRAYQWGWEYYYPKDIDLNYNLKKNYSYFVGNSLKYNKMNFINLSHGNLWKFYQNKNYDNSIIPSHLILNSIDNFKYLNLLNLNDVGLNTLQETNVFKNINTFFKFNNKNLINMYSLFDNKFKNFNKYFSSNLNYYYSYLYGIKRQHNFLINNNTNSKSTFINYNNFLKTLNYNYNVKLNQTNNTLLNFYINIILNKSYTQLLNYNLIKLYLNKNFIHNYFLINNQTNNYFYFDFLIILNNQKNQFLINNFLNNVNLITINNQIINSNLINFFKPIKTYNFYSTNKSIENKFMKNFINYKFNINNFNFQNDIFHNTNTLYTIFENKNKLFYYKNLNWNELNYFNKINKLNTNFHFSFSPIFSNSNILTSIKNYEKFNTNFKNSSPYIFQKNNNLTSPNWLSLYWNNIWNNSSSSWKIINNNNYSKNLNLFYLPNFYLTFDYDFKNWQSFELLENLIWDNIYNINNYEEYLILFYNFYIYKNYKIIYNDFNAIFNNSLWNSDIKLIKNCYSYFFYIDDIFIDVNVLNLNNFFLFQIKNMFNFFDNSYENFLFLKFFNNCNYKINLINHSLIFTPYSYSFVFNFFKSNFNEHFWFNNKQNLHQILNLNSNIRINETLNLRNTIKNSLINYNALQKVFKIKVDIGRSNIKLNEFFNFYSKQTNLNSPKILFDKLLGKNKENFFKINFYKTKLFTNFNLNYNFSTNLNFYIFDFPFLLSTKSESSKYFWLDWFSKWENYEVQPSSLSKYSISGMPTFNKFFNFTNKINKNVIETENYLNKIFKSRKNYLLNWTYSPYLLHKNSLWLKNNIKFTNLYWNVKNNVNILILSKYILNNLHFYLFIDKIPLNLIFSSSISNNNSYNKNIWNSKFNIFSYYATINNLSDILTKKEFLIRQLFINNNKLINLPIELTNSFNNKILIDFKTIFFFIDSIILNNEYSKNIYYNSLAFFNYFIFLSFFNNFNNSLIDNLFLFFFDKKINNTNNLNLFKNQFKPLKKGINQMLRLHATKAIALPIEIRLQILASSKDVIHSWAIPSAGIKIDCVPGYSSHKTMIFLISGIFWGQCMEICGRYHHWMPIVVYFMKKDLFFLWCSHFVFSNHNSMFTINDKQNINFLKTVNSDKISWLNEIIN